jgi:RNA ligase (TIGR02306 family)
MERKLATIRKVTELRAIPGADFIEMARIDGWECVVKKGEFKPGDLGMYFEIDSFVDTSKEPFKFLEKTAKEWEGKRGSIIRTVKLKGQVSQGLLLPLSPYFEDYTYLNIMGFNFVKLTEDRLLDMDFTKELGVLKYEKIAEHSEDFKNKSKFHKFLMKHFSRETRSKIYTVINWFLPKKDRIQFAKVSSFPSFIPKTDEPRIQNIYHKLKAKGGKYIPSLKLDGSSTTYWTKGGEFGVASRNVKLGITDGSNFSKVALKYRLPEILPEVAKLVGIDFAIQGELMGPNIQGNREGLEDHDFFVFRIWDITNQKRVEPGLKTGILGWINLKLAEMQDDEDLKLKQTVLYPEIDLDDYTTVEEFLEFAEGPSLKNAVREGLVFENVEDQTSFKVISNKYLLKLKD